jgi:hypothetical protein
MASTIQVDTIKDIGGNTIISSNGSGTFTSNLPAPTSGIVASAIDSGTIATARLGSGTASSSTFLRGDQTYAAPASGGGITEADTWRVTANFAGDATPIASNWERDDTDGYGNIGTGMSQSSGVFTFPSTGFYRVTFYHQFSGMVSGPGSSNYVGQEIQYTADNSSYDGATAVWGQIFQNGSYNMTTSSKIFDITDISNQKVRFTTSSAGNNVYTQTSTSKNTTYAMFTRLGDT